MNLLGDLLVTTMVRAGLQTRQSHTDEIQLARGLTFLRNNGAEVAVTRGIRFAIFLALRWRNLRRSVGVLQWGLHLTVPSNALFVPNTSGPRTAVPPLGTPGTSAHLCS